MEKNPKTPKNYFCEICNFTTSNKKDFNRHLLTRKHKIQQNTTTLPQKEPDQKKEFLCECGKSYLYRASLYNHKKKCKIIFDDNCDKKNVTTTNTLDYNHLICKLIEDNKEMRDLLKEQQEQHSNEIKGLLPKIGNSVTNNTQFNINLFLNEECKNAINLSDFVDKLSIEIKDLVSVAENGFIEGIGKRILDGLKQLSIYERPIHCTDKKRDTLYIKESNTWNKDTTEHELMKSAIQKLKKRNMKQITEILQDDSENKFFNEEELAMKIIHNHVQGRNNNEQEKSMNKIIKNVSKEVLLDKNKLTNKIENK